MSRPGNDRISCADFCQTLARDRRRFLQAGALGAVVSLLPAAVVRAGDLPPFTGHRDQVTGLAFSPDGQLLLSGSADGTVRLWDVNGRPLGSWPDEHKQVLTVAFAPDGRSAASAGSGRTTVWDMPAGRRRHRFDPDFARRRENRNPNIIGACRAVAFGPDGRLVAVGDAEDSGTAAVRNAVTGRALHRFPGDTDIHSLAFSPDGRWLAVGGQKQLYVWDLTTGRRTDRIKRPFAEELEPLAFSPDGRWLVGGCDAVLIVWDVASGERRVLRDVVEEDIWIRSLAVAPDGRTAAVAGFHAGGRSEEGSRWAALVRVVELTSGQVRFAATSVHGWPGALAFSPDGRTLASGHADGTLLLRSVDALAGPPPARPTAAEATRLWENLASLNAGRAFRAMRALQAHPAVALPLLRRLRTPAPVVHPQTVQRLIARLDADAFPEREQATRGLASLGKQVMPSLRRALEGRPSPEAKRRLERLLEELATPDGEGWRPLRAVEVLEGMGTSEAKDLLKELAAGPPEAALAAEARAALKRLGKAYRP
jgi:WD40 repeat protein